MDVGKQQNVTGIYDINMTRVLLQAIPIFPEKGSHVSLSEDNLNSTSANKFDNMPSFMNDSASIYPINHILVNSQKVHLIVSCVFGALFSLLGIPGNIISLYGWSKVQKTSSTSRYMVFQSAVDVVVCILYFIHEPLSFYYPEVTQETSYGAFYSYFGSPVYSLLIFTSNWNLAATTTDRYFKVCRPTFAKSVPSRNRIFIFLSTAVVFCLLLNIPQFVRFKPRLEYHSSQSTKAYVKTLVSKTRWYEMWKIWIHCWFLMVAPLLVTMTGSCLIVRRVRQMEKLHRLEVYSKTISRMLMKTSVIFVARIAVQCITQCMVLVFVRDVRVAEELMAVTKLGKIFNCSINVLIYIKCTPKFRKILKEAFGRRKFQGKSPITSNDYH